MTKEKQIALFKTLNSSQVGKDLVEYLKDMQSEICDVRTWDKEDTMESALIASRMIQKIIDKIVLQSEKKSKQTNDFQ